MPRRNTLLWTAALFGFWVVLSGKLDALHLAMGAASALAVTAAIRPLLVLEPAIGPLADTPLTLGLAGRFPLFVGWLVAEIVVSSLQVARVVLDPKLPIDPHVVRLRPDLPHPLARLTLANAITLTPGTVTLDAAEGELHVHALTRASARGLGSESAEGDMPRRVRALFAPEGAAS